MTGSKKRVLIVEDQAVVAIDIEQRVRHLGYEVVGSCRSAEDALATIPEAKPDLILMDIRLRGAMTGIEAGRQILEEWQIPVVYLTAHADPDTLRMAKETAPYGYIVKPFDEDELRVTLALALEKRERDLKASRHSEDLEAVLDALPSGTILLTSGGDISLINRPAQKLLGVGPEVKGQAWKEALGFAAKTQRDLLAQMQRPSNDRQSLRLDHGASKRALEATIVEDPRGGEGQVLTLTDISEIRALRRELKQEASFDEMLGTTDNMKRVFELIEQLGPVDSSVLIHGDTGTGKELVAKALHRRNHRANSPFIAVNCGGLSEELAASQLFGHREGAFTGATSDHPGYFEAASGGTLFLDEIGELSEKVQINLLRVLEERRVNRIGETKTREVDVRLLVATHRDLTEQIAAGRFRADLYYRIRVAQIDIPALGSRRKDIPLLADHFLTHARAMTHKEVLSISDQAMHHLLAYRWPGNVRELKNAIEFAVIRTKGDVVQVEDLAPEIIRRSSDPEPAQSEEERIRIALSRAQGNRKRAAELLGISRATFYRRLAAFEID